MTARCPGHARHWYSFYGMPGYRSPVCVRCSEPNPRPLSAGEWDELMSRREQRGRPFRPAIEAAITAERNRRLAA